MIRKLMLMCLAVSVFTPPAYAGCVLDPLELGPTETTVSFDQNTFDFEFLGVSGNTLSYEVEEIGGKDLSHWSLVLSDCIAAMIDLDNSTAGYEVGPDNSTSGQQAIKWNFDDGFSYGIFEISLFGEEGVDWAIGTTDVIAKAGPSYGVGEIAGAECIDCEPETHPAPLPSAAFGGLALLGLVGLRRGRG